MLALVVEDDATWAGELAALLGEAGWSIDRVETAEDGLEHLAQRPLPDLILLDLVLPRMDGWAFYRHLRTTDAWSKIPVLVLTGAAVPPIPLRGIVGFLQKRDDRSKVIAEVRQRLQDWKVAHGNQAPERFQVVVPDDMKRMIDAFPPKVSLEIAASLQNASQMVAHELPLTSTWLQAITGGDEPTLVVRVDDYRVMIQLSPVRKEVTVIAVLSPSVGWRGIA